jgi:two-component system response regulator FixJ
MPGMTGVELVETLRARDINIPVIMFTGRPDAALKQRALRAGVLIVLDKPVNEEHLLQAISIARISAKDIH